MFICPRMTTIIIAVVCLCGSAVQAADFANTSFQGNYSHTAAVGDDVAVAGICTADGAGNFSCPSLTRNRPGSETERTVDTLSVVGTYVVNSDGSGSFSETLTFEDGSTAQANSDFVVRSAVGTQITNIYAVQREPAGAGALLTSSFFRLPD